MAKQKCVWDLSEGQIARANQLSWYHGLNFGDYRTVGRFSSGLRPNATLFGVMDLLSKIDVNDMRCLDVGCAHGVVALGLALRGGNVTATDVGAPSSAQIDLASEIYGVRIDYRAPIFLESIRKDFELASFDLIVCAGVMYHLLNPADVFFKLRPLLKRDGLLVMESAYHRSEEPVLVLNSELGEFDEPTTYFLPSSRAITGLAKLACLDVLATRTCRPGRFALVGRATVPDEVTERSEMCEKIHDFGLLDESFHYARLSDAVKSSIRYTGQNGHGHIDMLAFENVLPSHPDENAKPLGQGVTAGALKNFIEKAG